MRFQIYKTGDQYGWRLLANNGKIVAIGGEAYQNLADVRSILRTIFGTSLKRSIEVEKALRAFKDSHVDPAAG